MSEASETLRETVKSLMDNLQIHAMMPSEQITMNRAEVCAMIEDCRAALAAPSRQCDVGTADEQFERWQAFCGKYDDDCTGCPCDGDTCASFASCFSKWAQMPYEEGGAK